MAGPERVPLNPIAQMTNVHFSDPKHHFWLLEMQFCLKIYIQDQILKL